MTFSDDFCYHNNNYYQLNIRVLVSYLHSCRFSGHRAFVKTAIAVACSAALHLKAADTDQITVTANSDADTRQSYTAPQTTTASKTPTLRLDEAQSVSVVTQRNYLS